MSEGNWGQLMAIEGNRRQLKNVAVRFIAQFSGDVGTGFIPVRSCFSLII